MKSTNALLFSLFLYRGIIVKESIKKKNNICPRIVDLLRVNQIQEESLTGDFSFLRVFPLPLHKIKCAPVPKSIFAISCTGAPNVIFE